jgi:hypothetical protein
MICPIHNNNDPTECKNYRGIALLNTVDKILSNITRKWLKTLTEKQIGSYQAGFSKSTVVHTFSFRQVYEKTCEYNIQIEHLFVDFKSTYDTGKKEAAILYKVTTEFGIPQKFAQVIKTCLDRDSLWSTYPNRNVRSNGLRQGDALACLLLDTALEKLRNIQEDRLLDTYLTNQCRYWHV